MGREETGVSVSAEKEETWKLSPRERAILGQMKLGLSNEGIAEALCLAVSTVKNAQVGLTKLVETEVGRHIEGRLDLLFTLGELPRPDQTEVFEYYKVTQGLRKREAQILACQTMGLTNAPIAEKLRIKISTVKDGARTGRAIMGAEGMSGFELYFRMRKELEAGAKET